MAELITKYKTLEWNTAIKSVFADRETETSVWIDGSSRQKAGMAAQYHDTWEAAHAFLLERAERNQSAARRSLEIAQGEHGNIKGMKPPAPTKEPSDD